MTKKSKSGSGHAALEGEEDQVCTAADAEFAEQVGNVKFHSTLGDVEFASDFLVGKIFEQGVEDLLLATTEIGNGIGFETAALIREDGIDESGKDRARNPETAAGYERQRTNQLIAGFRVGKKTLNAEAEELIAIGVGVLFANDDEARFRMTFEKIGQKSAGGGTCGMAINDVDLRGGRFEIAHVWSERGFKLLDDDFELRLRQNAFELAQHQGVRRQDANSWFGTCSLGSHYVPA